MAAEGMAGRIAGMPSQATHGAEGGWRSIDRADLVRIAVTAAGALVAATGLLEGSRVRDGLLVAIALVCGWPVWAEALGGVRERRMTMELSMALAIVAALVLGELTTVLLILLFVLVAEVLEHMTIARGRRALRRLAELLPDRAVVRREDVDTDVPLEGVRPGDEVLVKPGARIPVDGTVVSGASAVDQASITGEPWPAEKRPGDAVYAGTVNQRGALTVRTQRIGRQTTFGRILDAVEKAEALKAPVQRLADRLAGWLVYFTLGCAAITYGASRDAKATIAVIIAAGACGVAAGTPLALLAAVGRSARAGALVRGGVAVEGLSTVDTVVLDKTGTLTMGEPVVVGVRPARGVEERDLVGAAAAAERRSEHSIAGAILRHAERLGVPVDDPSEFHYEPGQGVRALVLGRQVRVGRAAWASPDAPAAAGAPTEPGLTQVFVARDGAPLGSLVVTDALREDAEATVAGLHALGLRTVLLSGDAPAATAAVARRLGIEAHEGALLPEQKLLRVEALLAAGRKVAVVGDGINDAPALARADVGVAMGGGTDAAKETAGVVLIGGRLAGLVEAIRVARRARRVIHQNFAGRVVVDALAIVVAALGFLPPVAAGLVHVGSELAFILNSARLLPR
jgi:Cd2+/Zn2+-exporting ATPase/Cu+-exporting ATPase